MRPQWRGNEFENYSYGSRGQPQGSYHDSYQDPYGAYDQYPQQSGYEDHSQTNNADKLPDVAIRLWNVRKKLNNQAAKVYAALQQCLFRQGNHVSPGFEKEFQDQLNFQFPEADLKLQQIGGWNQWQVTIDDGKPVYCSVRMEVLSDDADVMRAIKSQAKVIRETLLDDGGKWKRIIERGASRHDVMKFKQECANRTQSGQGSFTPNNRWMPAKPKCTTCGKPSDDDQCGGEHLCQVQATFECAECGHTWTSHQGRLRPGDRNLIGQMCARCSGEGVGKDWKVPNDNHQDWDTYSQQSRGKGGQHQSQLCGACRAYGNCMGIFYDPFIVTTALALYTGSQIKWIPHSQELPELLVADLGDACQHLQVCLQPHVYIPEDAEADQFQNDQGLSKGRGKGTTSSNPAYAEEDGMAVQQDQRRQRARLAQRFQQQRAQYQQDHVQTRRQHEQLQHHQAQQQSVGNETGYQYGDVVPEEAYAQRQAGGVKNERLYNRFVNVNNPAPAARSEPKSAGPPPPSGVQTQVPPKVPVHTVPISSSSSSTQGPPPPVPQNPRGASYQSAPPPAPAPAPAPAPRQPKAPPPDVPRPPPVIPVDTIFDGAANANVEDTEPASQAPAANPQPEANLSNTGQNDPNEAAPSQSEVSEPPRVDAAPFTSAEPSASAAPTVVAASSVGQAPLFNTLPRLRKQQLMQMAARKVQKDGGDVEAEKTMVAEQTLSNHAGDFDEAYQFLKNYVGDPDV